MYYLAGMNGNCAHHRQMEYKPVTAYTANQPVLVNGKNINTGPYPVLNFQPQSTQSPYIYVPIAEFSKVGASVEWKEAAKQLSVISDYSINKSLLQIYEEKLAMWEKGQLPALEKGPSPKPESFDYGGIIEGINMYQVGGILFNMISDEETVALTPGKSYKGYTDMPEATTKPPRVTWLMVVDDNENTVIFSTTRI